MSSASTLRSGSRESVTPTPVTPRQPGIMPSPDAANAGEGKTATTKKTKAKANVNGKTKAKAKGRSKKLVIEEELPATAGFTAKSAPPAPVLTPLKPSTEVDWTIIESYFKENYLEKLVRHQLESYNNFVGFQIQKTIEMFNPFMVAYYGREDEDLKIKVYINFNNFK